MAALLNAVFFFIAPKKLEQIQTISKYQMMPQEIIDKV